MPDNSTTPLTALRQSIEALALELALGDFSSAERFEPLAPMLAEVRHGAEAAGMPAVAETAATVSGRMRSAPDGGTEPLELALREAVSRMQQLIAAAARE